VTTCPLGVDGGRKEATTDFSGLAPLGDAADTGSCVKFAVFLDQICELLVSKLLARAGTRARLSGKKRCVKEKLSPTTY
jgi:hypothetical protein